MEGRAAGLAVADDVLQGQDFAVTNGYFAIDFAAACLSVAAGPPV